MNDIKPGGDVSGVGPSAPRSLYAILGGRFFDDTHFRTHNTRNADSHRIKRRSMARPLAIDQERPLTHKFPALPLDKANSFREVPPIMRRPLGNLAGFDIHEIQPVKFGG